MRICILIFKLIIVQTISFGQPGFVDSQRAHSRVSLAFKKMEDSLMRQVKSKNFVWPPSEMYIRSFKFDRQLEVWLRNPGSETFALFKVYKVCMQSGSMGPKRVEGDYQVPEGFYYINEFNPNSMYHLSLGLNYPNASDKILSDPARPGNNIYIHGNCVSTGCIPITDVPIEELYILASNVKSVGLQEFIPVHVFPVKYNVKKSYDYLATSMETNPYLQDFNKSLKAAFDYFEQKKKLPVFLVNRAGEYVIN